MGIWDVSLIFFGLTHLPLEEFLGCIWLDQIGRLKEETERKLHSESNYFVVLLG